MRAFKKKQKTSKIAGSTSKSTLVQQQEHQKKESSQRVGSRYHDPLTGIFEKNYLYYQTKSERKNFTDVVIKEYFNYLRQQHVTVPYLLQAAIVEELTEQIRILLREKIDQISHSSSPSVTSSFDESFGGTYEKTRAMKVTVRKRTKSRTSKAA